MVAGTAYHCATGTLTGLHVLAYLLYADGMVIWVAVQLYIKVGARYAGISHNGAAAAGFHLGLGALVVVVKGMEAAKLVANFVRPVIYCKRVANAFVIAG